MSAIKMKLSSMNLNTIKWILMVITIFLFALSAAAPGSPGDIGVRSFRILAP